MIPKVVAHTVFEANERLLWFSLWEHEIVISTAWSGAGYETLISLDGDWLDETCIRCQSEAFAIMVHRRLLVPQVRKQAHESTSWQEFTSGLYAYVVAKRGEISNVERLIGYAR